MVKLYADAIESNMITIDKVSARWKDAVLAELQRRASTKK